MKRLPIAINKTMSLMIHMIISFLICCGSLCAENDDVILTVERTSRLGGILNGVMISANGAELGTVASGNSKKFTFKPADNFNNIIKINYNLARDTFKSSDAKTVVVGKGGEIFMVIDGSSVKITKLEVKKIGKGPIESTVELDKELKKIVVKKSPPIHLAAGTEKTIEDKVKVSHTVTVLETWKADVETKSRVAAGWATIELGIRAGIEKSTGKTYGIETERTRSIMIKGNSGSDKVRAVWVEYYRTGTATAMVDGKVVKIPFEFKEDFDLLTERAE